MNLQEQKAQISSQISAYLAKPNLNASERAKLNGLMAQAKDVREAQQRKERAEAAYASAIKDLPEPETDEFRAAKFAGAFARYLRGDDVEIRTYSALTTAGVSIPEGFLSAYVEKLKSFSGIWQVANVINTTDGHSIKNPYADDTANTGERLNENDPVSLANPVFNKTTFGAYRYASKGLKYSAALLQDAGIDVAAYLSKIFSRRIATLQNQEFTLGGSGAMAGVVPSITSILTSANSTSVSVGEIIDLQNIDESRLSGAVYQFHPTIERFLKKMEGTDGLPAFPEMRTARLLCGFPYTLNTAMTDTLSAGAKAIVFGNFAEAVTIRSVVPSLLVSKERYAEMNQLYAAMRHDADCQVVLPDALNVLQQHS